MSDQVIELLLSNPSATYSEVGRMANCGRDIVRRLAEANGIARESMEVPSAAELIAARKARGMRQIDLASAIGLSLRELQYCEAGVRKFLTPDVTRRICEWIRG